MHVVLLTVTTAVGASFGCLLVTLITRPLERRLLAERDALRAELAAQRWAESSHRARDVSAPTPPPPQMPETHPLATNSATAKSPPSASPQHG